MRFLTILPTLVLVAACSRDPARAPTPQPGAVKLSALFIGNSLTYFNDLPETVARIGRMAGDSISIESATAPNVALIDHINGATDAVDKAHARAWDYIILQQGPTTTELCRDSLVLWTRMWANYTTAIGAKPALFMTWPYATQQDRFDEVRISFHDAALAVDGVFIPAGEAWREAWKRDRDLALYGADGFHPSPLGSFLAALTIYERITGRDARSLPPFAYAGSRRLEVAEATVRILQQAAHSANEGFPRSDASNASAVTRVSTKASAAQC